MLIETGLPCPQGTAVVIEDDLDIRNLVCAVLRQAGLEVHSAATGQDGVDLVRRTSATVVTLDIGLPDIDGYEVLRRIRSFSDCHVMMLTARTAESAVIAAMQCGADDYLTKPFRPRELRARIEAVPHRLRTGAPHTTPVHDPVGISTGRFIRRSWRPLRAAHGSPESAVTTVAGMTAVAASELCDLLPRTT